MKLKMTLFTRVCGVVLASAFLSGCVTTASESLWEADCNSKARYQTPKDRPYIVRQVSIQGGAPDVMLAGELTLPHGPGPFPGAVLISGSALADRDSAILGHKPFLVLADYLTRRGYAVFRHDDRGYGESTGDSVAALDADFSADAAAALKWLRMQEGIDVNRVGYIGHSRGGYKATLASQIEKSDFMIFLVGSVESIGGLLLRQAYDIAKAAGASEEDLRRQDRELRGILGILRSSKTVEEAKTRIEKYALDEGASKQLAKILASGYAKVDAKITGLMKAYDRPILALYGGKDLIASAAFNAPLTGPLLTHSKSKTVVLPDLNHFMQPVPQGSKNRGIEEVCDIETTFDIKALEIIGEWLDEATRESE